MESMLIICGPEDYLRDREQDKYIAGLAETAGNLPEIVKLTPEFTAGELGAQLEFSPLFAWQRLVVIKDPPWLTANYRKVKHYKQFEDLLLTYLQSPPPEQTLLINLKQLPKQNPLAKALQVRARIVSVDRPAPAALKQWLQQRMGQYDKQLAPVVLEQLAKSGQDMYYLDNFIRQLAVMDTGSTVQISDVQPFLDADIDTNIFKLLDALFARRLRPSWQAWQDLLATGAAEGYILFMIIRQLELLCRVKAASEEGMDAQGIAEFTGQKPYPVKKMLGQQKYFSWQELQELQKELLQVDLQLKSSAVDVRLLLEMVMFRLVGD